MVLWRPTRTSRTNTPKISPFCYRGLNAKIGSQETPEITGKFGPGVQNVAEQRLTEFCQENALVIASTVFQKHKRQLKTWIPDGQLQNQIDIFFSVEDGEALYNQHKTRLGGDCGSDHELLIAKFRLQLKKVGKTTRPFRYDLNHTPYNYTVEVTSRSKGLKLINRVPEKLWTEVGDIVQEADQDHAPPQKRKQKAKGLSEVALQMRKGKIYPSECRVPKNSKER